MPDLHKCGQSPPRSVWDVDACQKAELHLYYSALKYNQACEGKSSSEPRPPAPAASSGAPANRPEQQKPAKTDWAARTQKQNEKNLSLQSTNQQQRQQVIQEGERNSESAVEAAKAKQKQLDAKQEQRDLQQAKAWKCFDDFLHCRNFCLRVLHHESVDYQGSPTAPYIAMRKEAGLAPHPTSGYPDAHVACEEKMCGHNDVPGRHCFNSLYTGDR
jgi:hypothetical protein